LSVFIKLNLTIPPPKGAVMEPFSSPPNAVFPAVVYSIRRRSLENVGNLIHFPACSSAVRGPKWSLGDPATSAEPSVLAFTCSINIGTTTIIAPTSVKRTASFVVLL
jgi:hypothetical protein